MNVSMALRSWAARFDEPAPCVAPPVRVPPGKIRDIFAKAPGSRSEVEVSTLQRYYAKIDPATRDRIRKIGDLKKELAGMKPATTVPVMRELPEGKAAGHVDRLRNLCKWDG